jgi:Fe-S oxidoreductase
VVHLAIAVPMLVIEVPFGKWSHLFYRPLAVFLTTVRKKAAQSSRIDMASLRARVGDMFMSCLQCGTCTAVCPWNQTNGYSPRRMLRHMALSTGTTQNLDAAVWNCTTCDACGEPCPRGISIVDTIRAAREIQNQQRNVPESLTVPLLHLEKRGNPWGGDPNQRTGWAGDVDLPDVSPEQAYCLFTCCTTAYDDSSSQRIQQAGRALPKLLNLSDISFGSFGTQEICCGDPALQLGDEGIFSALSQINQTRFQNHRVAKILTTSPHCLHSFKNSYSKEHAMPVIEHYTELLDRLILNGILVPQFDVNATVTFHDPCYLGRYNGITEAPRRILNSITGIRLVEMRDNRDQSLCCGGGGGCAFMPNGFGNPLADIRIKQALEVQADIIATACPYCMRMLRQAIETRGYAGDILVQDIAELLLQSIEKTYEYPLPIHVNLELDQEVLHA